MKKLSKLLFVLGLILTTNTFAEELGIKLANLHLSESNRHLSESNLFLSEYNMPAAKGKSKSSGSSGGIEKGLVQFDIGFIVGGHGPVAGRGFRNGGAIFGVSAFPGAMFNVDVAVHPYASVGGYFGLAGQSHILGIALGARGVFHIYQLIADKANTKVDPGKLDFYFPFHMGTIIGVYTGVGAGGGATAGFEVGGGLGVKYYFTDMIGIMSEVGWLEMSVFKVGLAMKFK